MSPDSETTPREMINKYLRADKGIQSKHPLLRHDYPSHHRNSLPYNSARMQCVPVKLGSVGEHVYCQLGIKGG